MKVTTSYFAVLTLLAGVLGASTPVQAADRYTEARILQVETSDFGIYVFLQVVSGDAPPVGNGGSNEPLSKPYLIVSTSSQEAESRKAMLANVMVALTTGTTVRLRWDDTNARISHLLVRS
jgi:hypothetical protein